MDFDFYDLDEEIEEAEEAPYEDTELIVPPNFDGAEEADTVVEEAEESPIETFAEEQLEEDVEDIIETQTSVGVQVEEVDESEGPVILAEADTSDLPPDMYEVEAPSSDKISSTDNLSDPVSVTKRSGNILYPFLFLEYTGESMPKFKLLALQSMLSSTGKVKVDTAMDLNVYLKCQNQVILIGETTNYSLKALLNSSVFSEFKKYIKLSPDMRLDGDMMYAVCGINI